MSDLALADKRDDAPPASGAHVQTAINHHHTEPVRLSLSLRRLLAEQFGPDTLRHLACLMERERPPRVARRRLSEASVEELAEMIVEGRTPTIGWWRRAS